ncbi:MAG: toxin-antitoxin system HicB family antitoxin [Acidimicrobiia bacterium]|nr:toxin-antitoxin system HicB family antitoxin [Acidimicrobiia bacterium]
MKQVLLRVPASLHRRLAERAARDGRSVNALANELLDQHVDDPASRRDVIRARARLLNLLDEPRPTRGVSPAERAAALRSMQGGGPVLDDILADGR